MVGVAVVVVVVGGGEVGGVRQAEISSGEDRSRYNGRRNQPPCHGAPAAGHA
jgi:hypothetical protein